MTVQPYLLTGVPFYSSEECWHMNFPQILDKIMLPETYICLF